MKIPPTGNIGAIAAYERGKIRATTPTALPMRPDEVAISPDAASFSETFRKVMQTMQEDTPASQARVSQVKTQVAEGSYDVSADQIVGAILRGLRLDKNV